jgi:hypothetical protein
VTESNPPTRSNYLAFYPHPHHSFAFHNISCLYTVLTHEEDVDGALDAILNAIKGLVERGELRSTLVDRATIETVVRQLTKDEDDLNQVQRRLIGSYAQWTRKVTHDPLFPPPPDISSFSPSCLHPSSSSPQPHLPRTLSPPVLCFFITSSFPPSVRAGSHCYLGCFQHAENDVRSPEQEFLLHVRQRAAVQPGSRITVREGGREGGGASSPWKKAMQRVRGGGRATSIA